MFTDMSSGLSDIVDDGRQHRASSQLAPSSTLLNPAGA